MDFKSFIHWKKQENPRDVFNEHLEDFALLGKNPAFKLYLEIIEWRIHNLGERSGLRPKEAQKNAMMIEAFRLVLQDFKKIDKLFKQRDGRK